MLFVLWNPALNFFYDALHIRYIQYTYKFYAKDYAKDNGFNRIVRMNIWEIKYCWTFRMHAIVFYNLSLCICSKECISIFYLKTTLELFNSIEGYLSQIFFTENKRNCITWYSICVLKKGFFELYWMHFSIIESHTYPRFVK